jgi:hypothetical protein
MTSQLKIRLIIVTSLAFLGGGVLLLFLAPKKDSATTSGVQTYTSSALGVSFQYDATQAAVTESGNRIIVYVHGTNPSSGQHIERFNKSANEAFDAAIRRQILAEYDQNDCRVEVAKRKDGYQTAEITYRPPANPNEPYSANAHLCNEAYARANGMRYFLYDPAHPDRFYFLDIGQYAIMAGTSTPWQDTVRIN